MLVRDARQVARDWVIAHGREMPGCAGAFLHGSINWLADDAVLPANSDVDVMMVFDREPLPRSPGKLFSRDVLLEVSSLAMSEVARAELVLGQYHLAGSFHTASVLLDPSGHLSGIQEQVARDYAKRRWVERRCQHALEKIRGGYPPRGGDSFPEEVTGWLFPAGITTHVLLVAGLKNPTVRTRFLAARELLEEYGAGDFYASLLTLLGCERLSRADAERHLETLTAAFDAAKAVIATPFFFAADIGDVGRPVAIDGSRELIARGDQREAIFWMVATYSRCMMVFERDAPALKERFDPGFRDLLAELGIRSSANLRRRRADVERFLPRLWVMAETIMAANPGIVD